MTPVTKSSIQADNEAAFRILWYQLQAQAFCNSLLAYKCALEKVADVRYSDYTEQFRALSRMSY
jgi:hypothetical protein